MKITDVRAAIFSAAETFFKPKGYTVVWAENSGTRPPVPFVTLQFGDVQRSVDANMRAGEEEAESSYYCTVPLDVKLYTNGRKVSAKGKAAYYENTASEDMAAFAAFFDAIDATNSLSSLGIGSVLEPPIRDLTGLENSTLFRYTAMAEFTLSFVLDGTEYGWIETADIIGG